MVLKVPFDPNHFIHTTGADGTQGTGIVDFCPPATANAVVHTCHGGKLPNLDKKLQAAPTGTKGHSR